MGIVGINGTTIYHDDPVPNRPARLFRRTVRRHMNDGEPYRGRRHAEAAAIFEHRNAVTRRDRPKPHEPRRHIHYRVELRDEWQADIADGAGREPIPQSPIQKLLSNTSML